ARRQDHVVDVMSTQAERLTDHRRFDANQEVVIPGVAAQPSDREANTWLLHPVAFRRGKVEVRLRHDVLSKIGRHTRSSCPFLRVVWDRRRSPPHSLVALLSASDRIRAMSWSYSWPAAAADSAKSSSWEMSGFGLASRK